MTYNNVCCNIRLDTVFTTKALTTRGAFKILALLPQFAIYRQAFGSHLLNLLFVSSSFQV
jgi:hypothetical protein